MLTLCTVSALSNLDGWVKEWGDVIYLVPPFQAHSLALLKSPLASHVGFVSFNTEELVLEVSWNQMLDNAKPLAFRLDWVDPAITYETSFE